VDATVLDADVEAEEPGEAFRVQLENGEEQVISYALFGGKMRQVFGLW
jgi:translation initiation factor IF-1